MFIIYFELCTAASIQNASQTIGNKNMWYMSNIGKVLKDDSNLNTCICMNYRVHRYKGPLLHLPSSKSPSWYYWSPNWSLVTSN